MHLIAAVRAIEDGYPQAGRIVKYEIITPTQWTLSNGYQEQQGVAAKAMCGVRSTEEASFIFRAFDICSVCTMY